MVRSMIDILLDVSHTMKCSILRDMLVLVNSWCSQYKYSTAMNLVAQELSNHNLYKHIDYMHLNCLSQGKNMCDLISLPELCAI